MSKKDKHAADISAADEAAGQENEIMEGENVPMTEEEFAEEYQHLPLWQQVILVLLCLFGLTAVIMVIDFVVEFFSELIRHIV